MCPDATCTALIDSIGVPHPHRNITFSFQGNDAEARAWTLVSLILICCISMFILCAPSHALPHDPDP